MRGRGAWALALLLPSACVGCSSSASTPTLSSSTPTVSVQPGPDGFDGYQHHNLDVMNGFREGQSLPPLVLDAELSTFALAGSSQEAQDHSPHAHFLAAVSDGSLWDNGFATMAGENQGDPFGWASLASDPSSDELQQIDATLRMMFAEGPGAGDAHGHYENIMNPAYQRVGAGFAEVDGRLYLTNDFSD